LRVGACGAHVFQHRDIEPLGAAINHVRRRLRFGRRVHERGSDGSHYPGLHCQRLDRRGIAEYYTAAVRAMPAADLLPGKGRADRVSPDARARAGPDSQTSPVKVWGALGFRARQTRKQQYSVIKERAAGAPSQGRPN
jgi:hypothetical protein